MTFSDNITLGLLTAKNFGSVNTNAICNQSSSYTAVRHGNRQVCNNVLLSYLELLHLLLQFQLISTILFCSFCCRLIFFNAAFIKVDIEVIDITVFSLSHLLFFVCYDKMVVRAKKT